MKRSRRQNLYRQFRWRALLIISMFGLAAVSIVGRALQLQVLDKEFLERQADARHLRVTALSAHRGSILDRNGETLAASTPVDSVWADPGALARATDRISELAKILQRSPENLLRQITSNLEREFIFLRRHMSPEKAAMVMDLGIPGVYLQREYRRYYPTGEVTGHLLGFTDIDDRGQEGLELAYDQWLVGEPGAKRVIKDRLGRVIGDVESIRPARPGKDLVSSIDLRIQYLAYRELKAAVQHHRARSGSVVVMDITTGEVLAMVNQPSYNPNDRSQFSASRYRNRSVTDIFEPGSSFKPLVIAAALESGQYTQFSRIDTSPGYLKVPGKTIEDTRNLGVIPIGTILAKSSNVGASKVALSLDPEYLFGIISRFGIGQLTTSGFPGESAGLLSDYSHWHEIGQATLAYGYGLSLTPLQLAQAYAVLAADGIRRPLSLLRTDQPEAGERVITSETAIAVVNMLERVVSTDGTGRNAAVPGYRVAGKTGTSWKFQAGGYSTDRYIAVFAGLAPATDPRLVIVVLIDEPGGDKYYGGDVAAPVFSAVMSGALRYLAVPPDALTPYRPEPGTIVQARVQPASAAARDR
jgi:cell division protein FtsI (penicillin-binding protein 3)